MKDRENLKLGDAHVTPKKYPRSTSFKAWGFPGHPLLHQQKYQVISEDAIFLLLHILCAVLGASVYFALLSLLVFCVVLLIREQCTTVVTVVNV